MSIHHFLNRIIHGDCVHVMHTMPAESVDLIVTDPPYLVNYRSRDGRQVPGDGNNQWLRPAFAEMFRVLRPDAFCVSFYGWNTADQFLTTWREVGFQPVGHLVFTKSYSSKQGYTQARHECAYLLTKGRPRRPLRPLPDVLPWRYTGNRLHPTQKPLEAIRPLIDAYSHAGDIVLDPFAGSGTTAAAARQLHRSYVGIELDHTYWQNACQRLDGTALKKAA
jgi:site-specific DNA-methyltransferase (adenine-specific)